MIDYQALKELGLLGLIAWNLRETIALGKKVTRLETKLENGLTKTLDDLAGRVEKHIDGEEARIIAAVKRDPRARTRRTDR